MQWKSPEQLFPFLYLEKEVAPDMVDVILAVVGFVRYGIGHFLGSDFQVTAFFLYQHSGSLFDMFLVDFEVGAEQRVVFRVDIQFSPVKSGIDILFLFEIDHVGQPVVDHGDVGRGIHIRFSFFIRQKKVGQFLYQVQVKAGVDSRFHPGDERVFFLLADDPAHFEQLDLIRCRIVFVGGFVYFEHCLRQPDEFVFPFDPFPVESCQVSRRLRIVLPDALFHVVKQAERVDDTYDDFLDRDHFGIERDYRVLPGEEGGLNLVWLVAQVGEVECGLAERIGQCEPKLPVCIGDAADRSIEDSYGARLDRFIRLFILQDSFDNKMAVSLFRRNGVGGG